MCSWNKSKVLEEVDSSDGSVLEHESVVESFGGLQPSLFEPDKPNLLQDSSKQLQVTGTVYMKKDTRTLLLLISKNLKVKNNLHSCFLAINFMQAFYKYFYFLPTVLLRRSFFL